MILEMLKQGNMSSNLRFAFTLQVGVASRLARIKVGIDGIFPLRGDKVLADALNGFFDGGILEVEVGVQSNLGDDFASFEDEMRSLR